MSTLKELHRTAMGLMAQAQILRDAGNIDAYTKKCEEALAYEAQAAYTIIAKFEAEPTRSVLFRSAASIAYSIGKFDEAKRLIYAALSGTPHKEIKIELDELLNQIDTEIKIDVEPEGYSYLSILRDSAANLKVNPSKPTYGPAIEAEAIVSVMDGLNGSLNYFVKADFKNHFADDYPDTLEEVSTKMADETKLFGVQFFFASFSVSASSNLVVPQLSYSDKINAWRKQVFEDFKSLILFNDLNNDSEIQKIIERFDESDRRAIFNKVYNTFKENNGYTVSVADSNFKVLKRIPPIKKVSKEKLIPKKGNEENNVQKKLFKNIGFSAAEDGKISKKSDLLESVPISYIEFTPRDISEIKYGDNILYLSRAIELRSEYDNGEYKADNYEFDIQSSSLDYNEVFVLFNKHFIDVYLSYKDNRINIANLSVDEVERRNRFLEIVIMDDIK